MDKPIVNKLSIQQRIKNLFDPAENFQDCSVMELCQRTLMKWHYKKWKNNQKNVSINTSYDTGAGVDYHLGNLNPWLNTAAVQGSGCTMLTYFKRSIFFFSSESERTYLNTIHTYCTEQKDWYMASCLLSFILIWSTKFLFPFLGFLHFSCSVLFVRSKINYKNN